VIKAIVPPVVVAKAIVLSHVLQSLLYDVDLSVVWISAAGVTVEKEITA